MQDVKKFVTEYIQREYTVPEGTDIMTLNYIEGGYVDSLGLIQFIATLEDEFGIAFSDDDLSNPDIRIVGKLIDMINKKRNA